MKVKNVNLEWYVLYWDFNKRKVINHNILQWSKEHIINEIKHEKIYNKKLLKDYLKTYFIYNYWNKSEYEFFISDLKGNYYEKIDIWRQIESNLDRITEYVNREMRLNFK